VIHQIYISSEDSEGLPPYLTMAADTVKTKMGGDYNLYLNAELRDFIYTEYGQDMLNAYDRLIPFAFKADLARYLLLYKNGGWYFDISVRVVNGVSATDGIDFVTFVDYPQFTGVSFGCNNAIMYSKPNSKILENVIDRVYGNIRAGFYGKNTLCITGPVVLGKSIALFSDCLNVVTGSFVELTPGLINKNRGFVFNDGLLFALHKDGNHGGDLMRLGAKGVNNYVELYAAKNVFNNEIELRDVAFPKDF